MLLKFKGRKKAVSHDTTAGVLMLLCSIVALFAVIGLCVTFANSGHGNPVSFLASGIGFCILWFVTAIRVLYRTSRFRQLSRVLREHSRFKLAALTSVTRMYLEPMTVSLHAMLKRGYFGDAMVDLDGKELIFDIHSPPISSPTDDRDTIYTVHRKVPVLQILIGVFCALMFMFADGFNLASILMGVGIGICMVLLNKYFLPVKTYFAEIKRPIDKIKPLEKTGNEELDEMLRGAAEQNTELIRLNYAIKNPKINRPLDESLKVLSDMLQYVHLHQEKTKQLRQFMNYYLPTTVKLLQNYEELMNKDNKGENIVSAMAKIEEALPKISTVFKREYDDLFMDKAMDISAEIDVMKAMIDQSGAETPFAE